MNGKRRFTLKLKSIIIIIALSAVLCAVSIAMSAIRFSRTNEESFKAQSTDIARMAALTINGDAMKVVRDTMLEHFVAVPDDEIVLSDDWGSEKFNALLEKFAFIMDMPEYQEVLGQLRQTQTLGISTLSSIYAMDYDFTHEMPYALYLVDAAEEDPCLPGVIDHADEADWESAARHEGMDPYITNYDVYGWLVTATAPVYDSSGEYVGVVCVDLDMNNIKENETTFITALSIILVSLTALICVITLLVIDFAIIRPLNKLSDCAEGYIVDNENRQSFSSLNIKRSDEIGNLSDAMKKMEGDINKYVENITTITAEKERIGAELSVATRIQNDMLPVDFPKRRDFELFASMTPAKEVGGDFYDFFLVDDDHLGLIMADVSGKGVPAALFMAITKTILRNATINTKRTPSAALELTNRIICETNKSGYFVTAWLGVLTLSTGNLIYVNAGHEYPALMHKGGSYEIIESDNFPPLATMDDIEYTDSTIHLQKGDKLFLYTDGVPEAKAPDGSRFGLERMKNILDREKACAPEEIVFAVKSEVDSFTGTNDLFDDVTMMSVVWNGRD